MARQLQNADKLLIQVGLSVVGLVSFEREQAAMIRLLQEKAQKFRGLRVEGQALPCSTSPGHQTADEEFQSIFTGIYR